jgi:hypothetical protein
VFGWQKPCYLLQEGYAKGFQEMMDTTDWDQYGQKSGNPSCANCMVHCGHEPTAVDYTFGSWRGFFDTVRATLSGLQIKSPHSKEMPILPKRAHFEKNKSMIEEKRVANG